MLGSFDRCFLGCALALGVLIPIGAAQAKSGEKVLHTFTGGNDGVYPFAELIADKKGNLYGSTVAGGAGGDGTVFELAPDGTETVLYSFNGGSNGGQPQGGLIMDAKRNLYSTTFIGGTDDYGTVFELAPDGTETVLYSFTGGSDGANPSSRLIMDQNGNLYGTAVNGGADNDGTVFKLAPDGTQTVLHTFLGGNDGAYPWAPLIADKKGKFYGTTCCGGASTQGTVFELSPEGKETVLYNFCAQENCADGGTPLAALLMDRSGNLYSTTSSGGAANDGTVFELAPDGTETVLYSFCALANCVDGSTPNASYLIMDQKGNLYGTTTAGGKYGDGTVFELAPDGTEKVLHSFAGGTDGSDPSNGLLVNKKGNLYGPAFKGGEDGDGIVFEITK